MSNPQESIPGIGMPEEVDGASESDLFTADEYTESVKFKSWADQQLATAKSHLKRSCTRLLTLLNEDAPPQMVYRELAMMTQRCGKCQSALLDCGVYPTEVPKP